jgi:uncharacterized membrane protein YkoI
MEKQPMNHVTNTRILAASLAFALAGVAGCQTTAAAPTTPVADMAAVTPPVTTKAASPMVEADVRAALVAKGYKDINDVEFKEGTWTADAKSADGEHVEVKVDAATGKIYPDERVATMGKDQINIKMQEAGYKNVHDVEMEGGVWKVEANDTEGRDVELKVDPDDGHIIGSKIDVVGGKPKPQK